MFEIIIFVQLFPLKILNSTIHYFYAKHKYNVRSIKKHLRNTDVFYNF